MSLIKAMQFASRFRKKYKSYKKPKRKGLRGGMLAKKGAIGAAYNIQGFKVGLAAHGKKKLFGKAYGASHALKGQAIGQFAKR